MATTEGSARPLRIITGMHRSGTTLPGKILSSVPGLLYLHEPFNPAQGIDGLEYAYPCATADGDGLTPELARLFDQAFGLRARYRSHDPRDGRLKALVRRVVQGRSDLDQRWARAQLLLRRAASNAPLLVKDPFLLLASGHLVVARDARVVVMVRHPVAVWRSIERVGWKLSLARVGGPAFWAREALRDHDPAALEGLPELEKVGSLWRLLNDHAQELAVRWPEHVLLVKHEDFCMDPERWLDTIATHLTLQIGDAERTRVRELTTGAQVTPDSSRQHHFERDARALAWAWTSARDPDEEKLLRPLVEETVIALYGSWVPAE